MKLGLSEAERPRGIGDRGGGLLRDSQRLFEPNSVNARIAGAELPPMGLRSNLSRNGSAAPRFRSYPPAAPEASNTEHPGC